MPTINYESSRTRNKQPLLEAWPQIPYVLPMAAFVLIMMPGQLPIPALQDLWMRYFPAVYAAKTIVAAILLAICWKYYTPIRWNYLWLGAIVGAIGLVQWVGMEKGMQLMGWYAHNHPGPVGDMYIPTERISDPLWRYLFYAMRTLGPALVVPVMEELFFRDFVMRAVIGKERFQDVAIGTFTWGSMLVMTGLFAIEHFQWPSGIVYGLMMGFLLVRTKSLGACIVAHGVTNFLLGCYVMWTGDWQFW